MFTNINATIATICGGNPHTVSGQTPSGQKPIGQYPSGQNPRKTKTQGDKSPGGQKPRGTISKWDKNQGGQKPRGDKPPQGQKPMEDNIPGYRIPGNLLHTHTHTPTPPPHTHTHSLSLSLSLISYSATVREGVTKFEMPRQKLLNKCLFLFIAPFDLWPLPWHECANLCCDHDNWRKIAWIAPKFACRLSFTQGSDKFENQFGRTSTFKMAADLTKMVCAIFFKMP